MGDTLVPKTPKIGGLVELARQTLAMPALQPLRAAREPLLLCDGLLRWADRRRWWLWAVMLLMFAAGFNGQWRIQPDAGLYLSLGRNLAEGKGYTYLGEPHRLAYPGWPAMIGVVFRLFGSWSLFAVNAMQTLIALLTVAMVYRLFLLHCGRPTAVAMSVGVGLTKAFYCYGFELWADMPFALGTMSFLAGYEGIVVGDDRKIRRRIIDASLLIGGLLMALVTRPTVWPLLIALGCALPIDAFHRRIRWQSTVAIFTVVLIAAGAIFFGPHDFGANYGKDLIARLTGSSNSGLSDAILKNLRSLLTWAASDVLFQVRLGPIVNSMLSVIVLLLGFGLFRHRSLWGFWFCLLLGTILVSQATLDRYFLPVLPLLVFAWWNLLVHVNQKLAARSGILTGNLAFLGLLGFGCLMNFTKVCGIIAQQHMRPFLSHYDQGIYEVTPEFSRKLAEFTPPDSIILVRAPYGRVTAFLSRRNVRSAAEVPVFEAGRRPIYVVEVEPPDPATIRFIANSHLVEGPAVFAVSPSPQCGPYGKPMSLHATWQVGAGNTISKSQGPKTQSNPKPQ